jgi:small conductance mechanosensitive channel
MDAEKFQLYTENAIDWAISFAPKLLIAILIIVIGLFIVNKISVLIEKGLEKAKLDIEIREFLTSILTLLMKLAVFLIAGSIIGIEFTALLGLLAAMAFAVGMALQGFMGNFASGLTILFLKPYRVGDWVKVSDNFGKVKSVQIFNTTLETPNDKTLIVPNGQVTDNIITNFSTKGNIRLELNVHMPYAESYPKVESVIKTALEKSAYVLSEPAAQIGIEAYDSHNIVLAIRPYINPDDYWDATFEVYSKIKAEFSANKIQAAYSEGVELGEIGI